MAWQPRLPLRNPHFFKPALLQTRTPSQRL
jgi:hypothetical protein